MNKIKVVWVCHLSNEEIRECLHFDKLSMVLLLRSLMVGKAKFYDIAKWNTNAIKEFEKFGGVELHIISPHVGIKGIQNFDLNGIHYHFFKSEDDNLRSRVNAMLLNKKKTFAGNRKLILRLIDNIKPDIVHLIGAENPHYSSSMISLNHEYPLVVSLQTLMSDPEFRLSYPIGKEDYEYRSNIEKQVIDRADYIGTIVTKYQEIIFDKLNSNATMLNIKLAVAENIDLYCGEKNYDFVYFSADISKACDLAIEAFALAYHPHKKISLNVVGGFSSAYKAGMDKKINELGIVGAVTFTGKLPTHDDVLKQIKKSRIALLPLKIDIISGTIREAMACGLPVVTTITPGTPELNANRESVLLSPIGDSQALADNMLKVLNSASYAKKMQENAVITLQERYNNNSAMLDWVEAYKTIIESKHNSTHISESSIALRSNYNTDVV